MKRKSWKHWIPIFGIYLFFRDMDEESTNGNNSYIMLNGLYLALQMVVICILIALSI